MAAAAVTGNGNADIAAAAMAKEVAMLVTEAAAEVDGEEARQGLENGSINGIWRSLVVCDRGLGDGSGRRVAARGKEDAGDGKRLRVAAAAAGSSGGRATTLKERKRRWQGGASTVRSAVVVDVDSEEGRDANRPRQNRCDTDALPYELMVSSSTSAEAELLRRWVCVRWLQDLGGVATEIDSGIIERTSRIVALIPNDRNT
ncbi:hypothetical protein BHE74_00053762 [Ensete ventricosum]|nr:hypothetical protein BHE74_00053762 [Ensete ventricosum]RZR89141.1 hypothetical protein BHM03_00016809 [Ensete ventricosum]